MTHPAEKWSEKFNDSFERCAKNPQFLDTFYELFISSSNEVREKLKNTDMRKQKHMMMVSLSSMMIATKRVDVLHKTACKHAKNALDIGPHLYQLWMECLIRSVKTTDIYFDDEVEMAWRAILENGIRYMSAQYEA